MTVAAKDGPAWTGSPERLSPGMASRKSSVGNDLLSICASKLTQCCLTPGEDMRVAALVAITARRDYGANPKGQPLAKSHERALNESSRACMASSASGGSSLSDMQASLAEDDGWGVESAARAAYTAPHVPLSSSIHAGSSSMLAGSGLSASSTSMSTEGLRSEAKAALTAEQKSHLSARVLQSSMQSRHNQLHSLTSRPTQPSNLLHEANMLEHFTFDLHGGPSCMSLLASQAKEQLPEQRQHESQQRHYASSGVSEAALASEGDTSEELMRGQAGRPSASTSIVDSTPVKLLKLQQASTSSCKEAGTDRGFLRDAVQSSAEPSDRNATTTKLRSQEASWQDMVLSELEKLQRTGFGTRQQAAPQWVAQSAEDVSADMLLAQKLQEEELRWHQIHSRANAVQTVKRKLRKETTLDAFLKKPALGRD